MLVYKQTNKRKPSFSTRVTTNYSINFNPNPHLTLTCTGSDVSIDATKYVRILYHRLNDSFFKIFISYGSVPKWWTAEGE